MSSYKYLIDGIGGDIVRKGSENWSKLTNIMPFLPFATSMFFVIVVLVVSWGFFAYFFGTTTNSWLHQFRWSHESRLIF